MDDLKTQDVDVSVEQQSFIAGVNFSMLPETAIAVARIHKKQQFQKQVYTESSSEAVCDINTGASLVNARRSYLAVKVKLSAGAGTFGIGGVTNLIRRVVVSDRSGTELSRVDHYNLWAVREIRANCPKDFIDSFGSMMGYSDVVGEIGNTGLLSTTERVFLIPLWLLSPYFHGDGKSLIPAQAMAGLRIQLTLESTARAIVTVEDPAPTYEITDIFVMAQCTDLVDDWVRRLNEQSASQGLVYTYPEIHTTVASLPSNGTQISIDVRKAAARVLSAFVVRQTEAADKSTDNMKATAYSEGSLFHWRLGSMYPTNQPVASIPEAYYQHQHMFDAGLLDCRKNNSVSYKQFTNSTAPPVGAVGVVDGLGAFCVSLERGDTAINGALNLSGQATNNSRVLNVDITIPALAKTSTFYLFTKHLKIAKHFMDNSTVQE